MHCTHAYLWQCAESWCSGEVFLDSEGSITGQSSLTQHQAHLMEIVKVQYCNNEYTQE